MSSISIYITTYNRPGMLSLLLDDIKANKGTHKLKVLIFNDGSTDNYTKIKRRHEVINMPHHGKWRYYKIINRAFSYIKERNDDYYIFLPDDVRLEKHFFDEAIAYYESIRMPKKACINLLLDKGRIGKANWTGFKPRIVTSRKRKLWHTQWIDMCFIAKKTMFEAIGYNIKVDSMRWQGDGTLGSGVGKEISLKLHKKGYLMFQVTKTLVHHGGHQSKMNDGERKKNPLIT